LTGLFLLVSTVLLFLPSLVNGSVFYYADSGFYLLHDPSQVVDTALLWRPIVYNWLLRLPVLASGAVVASIKSTGFTELAELLGPLVSVQFAIFAQCFLVNLVLYLCAKTLHKDYRCWHHLIVLSLLMLLSPLGLYSNFVMTDIYASLLVLCWIAAFRISPISGRVSWVVAGLCFAVVHFSHLLATFGAVTLRALRRSAWKTLFWSLILLELSLLAIGSFNYVAKGQFQITNTAGIYIFSKLYSLGIVQEYMRSHCHLPEAPKEVCAAFEKNPQFHIWGHQEGFVESMGGLFFANQELTQISWQILSGPLVFEYFKRAASGVYKQWTWINFPLKPEISNAYLEKELSYVSPKALKEFRNQKLAHLVNKGFYANWGEAQAFIFFLCMVFVVVSWRTGQSWMTEAWKNAYVIAAAHYLSNGFVVGMLTDPESRYSNRLIWVLLFLVLLHFIAILPELKRSWPNDKEQRLA
jgi:hypothetical protein